MQIGVDSVLLGSWVRTNFANRILDIGAGCGLLSFMCAQQNPNSKVTGIDISSKAIEEAELNRKNSEWADRMDFHERDVRLYQPTMSYDLIISNPPFFNEENMLSADEERARARHTLELKLSDIFEFASQYLADKGTLNMVLPYHEYGDVMRMAIQYGFKVQRLCVVKPKEHKPAHRLLLEVGRYGNQPEVEEVIIRKLDNTYTNHYKDLTKDFYLD